MKRVRKICISVALVCVALFILAALLHPFILGPSIKTGVEKIGPTVTKTPITVDAVSVNLFVGKIELQGLKVANPEGFKTEAAVKVGAVKIRVAPLSVLSGTIHVRQVLVDGAEAWYEMGIPDSNIGKIQKNVNEFLGGDQKTAEKPSEKPAKPGKKVVIDDLQILNTKVHIGIKGLGGGNLPIPIPDIKQKDLGKDGEGKSIGEMVGDVLKSITGGISDAASGAGKAIGDGAKKAIGGAAAGAGKAIGSGLKGILGGGK